MKMLNAYKPSLDRIYGNRFPELRSSFQTLLMVLCNVEDVMHELSSDKERTAILCMLSGSATRHFELEAVHMKEHGYNRESIELHVIKHQKFLDDVELFCFCFLTRTMKQNVVAYRTLQKWLLHHLLMEDAHYMSKAIG